MKRTFVTKTFIIAALLQLLGSQINAQHINYERDSGWRLGLNIGGVWQDPSRAEMNVVPSAGVGFTFGHEWIKKGAPLSFELRFRYLYGVMYGQSTTALDTSIIAGDEAVNGVGNPGINYANLASPYYHNYRTDFHDYSLEGVLTLNRLRERTGIIFSLFGGIGINDHRVKTDLLDENGLLYRYDNLSDNPNVLDIRDFRDEEYESNATGHDGTEVSIVPAIGVYLGYQISPSFSMGIGHRLQFTGMNSFDGLAYDQNGAQTNTNDWFHYTRLSFRWNLLRGNRTQPDTNNDINDYTDNTNTTTTPIVTTPPPQPKPRIDIIDPYSNPHTTTNSSFTLRANIFNVNATSDITFKQNGTPNVNFTFNPSNNSFSSNVILRPGNNVFEIRAVNPSGAAYASRIIVYEEPQAPPPPPVVSINNPPYSPYITTNSNFSISATIFNVDNSSNINFLVNGIQQTGFNFNANTDNFNANITLRSGSNTIQITGTNTAGSDSKTVTIVYQEPVNSIPNPPVVNIIYPSLNPTTVTNQNITFTASVFNVPSRNNITVKVNGVTTTNFNYNATSGSLSLNRTLANGSNVFEVSAWNSDGNDYASTTVIYSQPNLTQPPVVNIINPPYSPYTVFTASNTVTAQVLNVSGPSAITVRVNGIQTNNFQYSASSKILTISTLLNEGANIFEISGTNSAGTAQASTTIVYEKEDPQLPPVVNFTDPSYSPFTTNSPYYSVQAQVLHVDGASDISVKLNGNTINNFNFNSSSKILSFNTNLMVGSNTVQVTGTNSAGTDSKSTVLVYQEALPPPPTVNITNPSQNPHTTSQQHININATLQNVTGNSNIQVSVNGTSINNFSYSASNGALSFPYTLALGNNVVSITGTNAAGSASDGVNIVYEPIQACDDPVINLTQPNVSPLNYLNASNAFNVQATITNVQSNQNIQFKFNGNSVSAFNFISSSGQFNATVNLNDGMNTIEIIATNSCGQADKTSTILYGTVDNCDNPTVDFTEPQSETETENTQIVIKATVTEIGSAQDIVFTHNGMAKSNFTYDPATKLFMSTFNLTMGRNKFEIKANNECGKANDILYIERVVCNEPVLTLEAPPSNYTGNSYALAGNVTGISGQSDLDVTLNGQSVNFMYRNGIISCNQPLQDGTNTFSVTATNECGSVTETITIEYDACDQPTLHITNPTSHTAQTSSSSFTISGATSNITNGSQVTIIANGAAVNPNFNSANGTFSANVSLQNGQNTIEVSVANECGDASETITITKTCNNPSINVINPSGGGTVAVTTTSAAIAASVTGITSQNQVSLTVNGQPSNFNYNGAANKVSSLLTLTPGTTTVVLSATNDCSTVSETIIFEYEEETVGTNPDNTNDMTCLPSVNTQFAQDNKSVTVNSNKVITNITLKFHDNSTQSFTSFSNMNVTLSGTGVHAGKCIAGVWVKSGCNDGTGPNGGPYFSNNSILSNCGNGGGGDTININMNGNNGQGGNDDGGEDEGGEGNGHRNQNIDNNNGQPDAEKLRMRQEEEARKQAEEEARRKREQQEAQQRAEEARRKREQQEAQQRAEEEARRKREQQEAQQRAEEEARRKREQQEAQQRAEEEARRKREQQEAQQRAEEEARRKREQQEAQQRAQEEARKKREQEEARRKAAEEAARKKREEEARKRAAEEARRKKAAEEAARKKAEEERRQREEQEKKEEEENNSRGGRRLVPRAGGGRGGL